MVRVRINPFVRPFRAVKSQPNPPFFSLGPFRPIKRFFILEFPKLPAAFTSPGNPFPVPSYHGVHLRALHRLAPFIVCNPAGSSSCLSPPVRTFPERATDVLPGSGDKGAFLGLGLVSCFLAYVPHSPIPALLASLFRPKNGKHWSSQI